MRSFSTTSHICLFGGTFDPIHLGHTYIAQQALRQLNFTKVILLPCRQSPHKIGKKQASHKDRLHMCKLATQKLPHIEVDDYELRSSTPSYSWKTAEHFKNLYPHSKLFWLLGADQWENITQWSRIYYLSYLVTFIIFARNNRPLSKHPFKHHILSGKHPASATSIRQKFFLQAQHHHAWLHHNVYQYINQHSLYTT